MSLDRLSLRRQLLLPLVPVYAAVHRWKQRVDEARGRRRSLEGVVLSVGSLSAGGAGKTPCTLAVAHLLRDRGFAVTILSRGYGRRSRAVQRVDPHGSADEFGDEPLLLARRGDVPVYVGADRFEAGRLAEQAADALAGMPVHVLDDGFQHRRLLRDLDIVLLTLADVSDRLLPAGNLREPMAALERADVVVVRTEEAAELRPLLEALLRPRKEPPVMWEIARQLRLPEPSAGSRPLVFSGIARPARWEQMLHELGVSPAGTVRFRDHQRYGRAEILRLLREARRAGADSLLTTEKDAVKLSGEVLAQLEAAIGPVGVAVLETTFVDERLVLEQLIGSVDKLNRRRRRR